VVLLPLLAIFVHVALRSGLLAPVSVTVAKVTNQSITPALFGIRFMLYLRRTPASAAPFRRRLEPIVLRSILHHWLIRHTAPVR